MPGSRKRIRFTVWPSLGDEGTAFLLAEGSFDENGLALDFLRDHLEELLVYGKTAAVLDLKSQLDLFTVPDREKLFDLSIGAYLVNPLKDHYPYEDIAKEYLDQLIPGRAELFGKDPWKRQKKTERCLQNGPAIRLMWRQRLWNQFSRS